MKYITHLSCLLRGVLGGAFLAGEHHVGLQQGTLKEDVMIVKCLVREGKYCLRNLLCSFQVMAAIHQHLECTE